MSYEERIRADPAFAQSYRYGRSWEYAMTDGAGAGESLRMTETHDASLQIASEGARAAASFGREQRWASEAPVFDPRLLATYFADMAATFRPGATALPAATLSVRSDKSSADLAVARRRYIGATARTEVSSRERDFDAQGARDIEQSGSLTATVPVSPDGRGDAIVTATATHALAASCADLPASVTELGLLALAYPLLLRPPGFYLGMFVGATRDSALRAVGLLADDSGLARLSGMRLSSRAGLSLDLRRAPWYLPSRVALTVESQTSRSGLTYAQSSELSARVGKSLVLPWAGRAPATLSADLTYRFGRTYTSRVVSHAASTALGLTLPVFAGGGIRLDHSLALTAELQRLDDPALALWPSGGVAEPAIPLRPDKGTLKSAAGLELWTERAVEGERSQLLFRSLPTGGERLVLRGRIDLENALVWTDPARAPAYTTVPFKVVVTQTTVFRQSEYLSLEMRMRAVAGAEDMVSARGTTRIGAFGLELDANAQLRF